MDDLHDLGKKDACNSKKEEEEEEGRDQNPTQNHLFAFSSSPSHSLSLSSSNLNKLEHMFDKVVTASDVGKLNRLVIPKQYAEKYFPLKPSATVTGIQLKFEDMSGKQWEFRYSYWNSSHSYVMTRGWNRFVRDNRLYKGDIVSFCRGRGRLFIDWHCLQPRPSPLPLPLPLPRCHPFFPPLLPLRSPTNPFGGGVWSFRSHVTPPIIRWGRDGVGGVVSMPIVVDLVRRVVDRPSSPNAKRFRLFGVDVECVGAGEPAMTPKGLRGGSESVDCPTLLHQ